LHCPVAVVDAMSADEFTGWIAYFLLRQSEAGP
jgi:hypothetical protein